MVSWAIKLWQVYQELVYRKMMFSLFIYISNMFSACVLLNRTALKEKKWDLQQIEVITAGILFISTYAPFMEKMVKSAKSRSCSFSLLFVVLIDTGEQSSIESKLVTFVFILLNSIYFPLIFSAIRKRE